MIREAHWRPMRSSDLALVNRLADRIHVDYPEDAAVFDERFQLYPAGCFMLERDGEVLGYAITHPWHYAKPPALNVLLGALPVPPSTYYIHDVALVAEARGSGAASSAVRTILAHGRKCGAPNVSLVAVNGSTGFWAKHGFDVVTDPTLEAKLKSYDDDARFMVRTLP